MIVRGGRGGEGEIVLVRLIARLIEHEARLDARHPTLRARFEDGIRVFGGIQDHRGAEALTGEARPTASGEQGGAAGMAYGDGRHDACGMPWDHAADGGLPVVRCIGGMQRKRSRFEAGFASDVVAGVEGRIAR